MALDPSELDFDTATMTARCVCVFVSLPSHLPPPPLIFSPFLLSSSLLSFPLYLSPNLHTPPLSLCRYEEQLREQQNQLQKEDLSDMVAEHAAKQKVGERNGSLLKTAE